MERRFEGAAIQVAAQCASFGAHERYYVSYGLAAYLRGEESFDLSPAVFAALVGRPEDRPNFQKGLKRLCTMRVLEPVDGSDGAFRLNPHYPQWLDTRGQPRFSPKEITWFDGFAAAAQETEKAPENHSVETSSVKSDTEQTVSVEFDTRQESTIDPAPAPGSSRWTIEDLCEWTTRYLREPAFAGLAETIRSRGAELEQACDGELICAAAALRALGAVNQMPRWPWTYLLQIARENAAKRRSGKPMSQGHDPHPLVPDRVLYSAPARYPKVAIDPETLRKKIEAARELVRLARQGVAS